MEEKWTEKEEREFQEYLRNRREERSRKLETLNSLKKELEETMNSLDGSCKRILSLNKVPGDREVTALTNLAQRILMSAVNNLKTVRPRPYMVQEIDEREERREFQRTHRRR